MIWQNKTNLEKQILEILVSTVLVLLRCMSPKSGSYSKQTQAKQKPKGYFAQFQEGYGIKQISFGTALRK